MYDRKERQPRFSLAPITGITFPFFEAGGPGRPLVVTPPRVRFRSLKHNFHRDCLLENERLCCRGDVGAGLAPSVTRQAGVTESQAEEAERWARRAIRRARAREREAAEHAAFQADQQARREIRRARARARAREQEEAARQTENEAAEQAALQADRQARREVRFARVREWRLNKPQGRRPRFDGRGCVSWRLNKPQGRQPNTPSGETRRSR